MAVWERNVQLLRKVWGWGEEKQTAEEVNNKIYVGSNFTGRTAWHLTAENGNLEVFYMICEWAEEKLTTEEVNNEMLLGTHNMRRTAWHLAAKNGNAELL